jgi:hypothetical protein
VTDVIIAAAVRAAPTQVDRADGLVRSTYLEEETDIERYNVVFGQLRTVAFSEVASRALVEQVLGELEVPPREGAE